MPGDYPTVCALLAGIILFCALAVPATRRALVQGFACLRRHPAIWQIPAGSALAFALFQVSADALLRLRSSESLIFWITTLAQSPGISATDLLRQTWRPALENAAATFHFLTITFPLSALVALQLMVNFRGTLAQLLRALRRRFPRAWLFITFVILTTALAALAKPATYLFLPELLTIFPHTSTLLAAVAINAAALVFELLVGLTLLAVIILLTMSWLRGSAPNRHHLRLLAVRRATAALRWVSIPILTALACVLLPFSLAGLIPLPEAATAGLTWVAETGGPLVLAILLLGSALIPLTLILRTSRVRSAWHHATHHLRQRPIALSAFLTFTLATNLALETTNQAAKIFVGPETFAALGVGVVFLPIQGALAGWLVAALVCLYKPPPARRKEEVF